MDVERGALSTYLVPARELETHYLMVFTNPSDISDVRKCITVNTANDDGPLMLQVVEATTPDALDGEVELPKGDWRLVVYGQNSGTNLDTSLTTREVHSELIRVN